MSLDKVLDFLFRRKLGLLITIGFVVVMMMAFSACLPTDLCGCFWQGCDCDDCAYACYECSDTENSCYYDSCGGEDSCVLAQCLYGPDGCQSECGDCYVDCGGANSSCFIAACDSDGCGPGCYEEDGFTRCSCANCMAWCDATEDPDSPIYEPELLYTLRIITEEGPRNFSFYENTSTYYGYKAPEGMRFAGLFTEPNGNGTQYVTEGGNFKMRPNGNITLYEHFVGRYDGIEFTVIINGLDRTDSTFTVEKTRITIKRGEQFPLDALPALWDIPGYSFIGWGASSYRGKLVYLGDTMVGFDDEFCTFDPVRYGYNATNSDVNNWNPNMPGYEPIITVSPYYEVTKHNVTVVYPENLFPNLTEYEVTYRVSHQDTLENVYNKMETKDGYKFVGLAKASDGYELVEQTAKVENDMTLYAIYRAEVLIHFKEEGVDMYSEKYYDGEIATLPIPKNIPVGEEYVGWSYSTNYADKFKTLPIGTSLAGVTLVPHFEKATYTITYQNAAGIPLAQKGNYQYGERKQLLTFDANDDLIKYTTFKGWKNVNTGEMYTDGYLPAGLHGDLTLIMMVEPKSYTISLDPGAGTVNQYFTSVRYGENFTLEVPRNSGSTFLYWYYKIGTRKVAITDSEGKSLAVFGHIDGYAYANDSTLDIELYAAWSTNTYTVTFDYAYNGKTEQVQYQNKDVLQAPATEPDRPGYNFVGWYYNGNKIENFSSYQVTSDMTLTARYEAKVYTITFMISEADGQFSNGEKSVTVTFTYTDTMITPSATPIRDGYRISGWLATPGGSLIVAANGQVMPAFKTMLENSGDQTTFTIYARWAEN